MLISIEKKNRIATAHKVLHDKTFNMTKIQNMIGINLDFINGL